MQLSLDASGNEAPHAAGTRSQPAVCPAARGDQPRAKQPTQPHVAQRSQRKQVRRAARYPKQESAAACSAGTLACAPHWWGRSPKPLGQGCATHNSHARAAHSRYPRRTVQCSDARAPQWLPTATERDQDDRTQPTCYQTNVTHFARGAGEARVQNDL